MKISLILIIIIVSFFLLSCTVKNEIQEFKGELEGIKANTERMKVEACELSPSSAGCEELLEKSYQEKEEKKQEIANTEIITEKERKEVYLCDFTKSACDFDVSVSTSGTNLAKDQSYLSITSKGTTGIMDEAVGIDKETNFDFSRVEILFDDFQKSVGYGDSIFSLSSRKYGWYSFIIYCEKETECQFITRYDGNMMISGSSDSSGQKQTKIIPAPSGKFMLRFDIEKENGFYWGNVYFNDQFMYRMNNLFDGASTVDKARWLEFGFRNHEEVSNKFRIKKIILYE